MFGLFKKQPQEKPLLTVFLDDKTICEISKAELPAEKSPTAYSSKKGSVLRFSDGKDVDQSHILSYEDGYFHFSIRVHENFACEADCLVSDKKDISPDAFQKNEVNGIRFQPFFLTGAEVSNNLFKGHGLFFRGLHFPGHVSPGNVSLSCSCDECSKSFRIKSFHAGFSNLGYFYSSTGKETLVVSSYVKGTPPALGKPNMVDVKELESKLPNAKDGSMFSYFNSFRCPNCGAKYIDFETNPQEREQEYYGNYLFGADITTYKDPNERVHSDAPKGGA